MHRDHLYKTGNTYRHPVYGLGKYCHTCRLLTTSDNQREVVHLSFDDAIKPVSRDQLRLIGGK